ncbi:chromatin accessibility complex protein 1 [Onthophagus taurus]|uniref:chromatin accessibility complex protein 1 n=1 Tax=Onthophagus taurus TaxID=166361 RepID=UPI000C202A2E|nr:DNA polymerase epsilon subunit C [Onthophagus taurus]
MAQLSIGRVKTIMKTADGVNNVGQDAAVLTTKATELFIKCLVKESINDMVKTQKSKKLNYNNLVNVIHKSVKYEFLETIIPKKITYKEYKQLMAKKKRENGDLTGSGSEDSESDSS